ncbi:Solute carrier organic anion transporter family member 1B1 [Bienertia sinuspersici]
MEVQVVKCDCCGLKEECTVEYTEAVKSNFNGKWLCGLCTEAVRDEVSRAGVEDAVTAHRSFCRKYNSSPASRVADGMRQMLRRRSAHLPAMTSSSSSSKKYGRSASAPQVL